MEAVLKLSFSDEKGIRCCACMLSFCKGDRYRCAAIGQRPFCPEEGGRRRDCPLNDCNSEEIKSSLREYCQKEIPQKPTFDGDGYAQDGTVVWDEWICPNCGSRYEVDYDEYDYCPNCGQKIDWAEVNESEL